ncbi:MAG: phytanoyl-CoA dioxygenase family protein [Actinomycetota bacterium]
MGTAAIPECGSDESADSMYGMLADAGCLVIHDMLPEAGVESVRAELAATMTDAHVHADDPHDFYPGNTRRIVGLMERSPTALEMMMDPRIGALNDRHLLPNCSAYQLHVTAGLEVGPGARDQILHREEDLFPFFTPPRPHLILATMWAISDFSVDNGGTQLVPGSHRWDADRVATPDEIARAAMPAGSVLVWLGGALHGAGANATEDEWRYGVILTYSLGWLRQEENQHLSMPLAKAFELPDETRGRMGFDMDYEGGLGFFDPTINL